MPAMLRDRLIFGPVMIALMLGGLWLDGLLQGRHLGPVVLPGGMVILVVFIACIVLASRELAAVLQAKAVHLKAGVLAVAGIVGIVGVHVIPLFAPAPHAPHAPNASSPAAWAGTAMGAVLAGAMAWHMRRRDPRGVVLAGAGALFAAVYMGVLPGFYIAIRQIRGPWVVLALMLVVKAADIGAYTVGRLIGRHKLIPWLSPGKTWEGLCGGLAFAAVVALGFAAVGRWAQVWAGPWWYVAGAGIVLGVVGQLGDLAASALKRDAGIKDSGRSIPGFGGVLDVADSPILAAPVAYWLVVIAAGAGW